VRRVTYHLLPERILQRMPAVYRLIAQWSEFASVEDVARMTTDDLRSAEVTKDECWYLRVAEHLPAVLVPGILALRSWEHLHAVRRQKRYKTMPRAFLAALFMENACVPASAPAFHAAVAEAVLADAAVERRTPLSS
jgi:hypothetical protein